MLPVEEAAVSSMFAGYLLLPSATSVNIPLLPPLDKTSIPAVSTFILCWMKGGQTAPPKKSAIVYCLALLFILAPICTSFDNSYELRIGDRSLPGLYPLDAAKMSFENLLTLLPFFVAMRFLSSDRGRSLLLRAFPVAGILYSAPMLFEVRFSPQLHRWVYGFFPHSFGQQVRDGGYRPVVFLSHGLEVALFASMTVIASCIAVQLKWRLFRVPAGAVAAYMGGVLLLCKTLGAVVYAAVALPIIFFTKPKTWSTASCGILLIVCAYPLLRTYDLSPVKHIAAAANTVSADRSSSFEYRVKNEDQLLAKANQKPFFGWGTWGRNRIYDQTTGSDVSITDGEWIIEFGMWGWFGYLSLFGLFAASAMQARKVVCRRTDSGTVVLAGMSLMLAVNMIDLIPNANLVPFTYMLAGSIAGCVRVRSPRRGLPSATRNSVPAIAVP